MPMGPGTPGIRWMMDDGARPRLDELIGDGSAGQEHPRSTSRSSIFDEF